MLEMTTSASGSARRVAIVGGGILGLGLARELALRGDQVTVFEAATELGGLASTWRLGDRTWDRHYHVILYSDTRTRALLEDLGLASELVWTQVGTGFYTGGTFHSMNGALDFLRFPPLGLIDKLRLGLTIAYASRISDARPLEGITVERWLTRFSGKTTFRRIWQPLLRAKLGERYRETSAAFIWATIVRLYAARRAGLGAERFGYVRGGYAAIFAALERSLRGSGVALRPGTPVASIAREGADIAVTTHSGDRHEFDCVFVTAPAPLAAGLIAGLSPDERDRLTDKVYGGIVCASVLLDAPLGPYYVTNLTDDWVPFSAVIDYGNVMRPADFGGRAVVYLPKYVAPDDPLFEESDEAIEATFLGALERMYPTFSRTQVRAFRISRVRRVFPIATLNYSDHVPPIVTTVPGVFVLNSTHIARGTLNVNETLELVERGLAASGREATVAG